MGHRKVLNEEYEPRGAGAGRGGRVLLVMYYSISSVALCVQNLGAVPSDCVA